MAAFIPMFLVMLYLLVSLSGATKAYADITQSVTYANQYAMDFKERMDNSMYLAVIGKKSMEELGDGETTVNGIVTVNPMSILLNCQQPATSCPDMATVDINRNHDHASEEQSEIPGTVRLRIGRGDQRESDVPGKCRLSG